MDRLSLLPDEVLGHILSFLPSKHAASTSLLSHRWRNVFVLNPSLNLDYVLDEAIQYRHDHSQDFMDFVESLLIRRGKSPVKKFALKIHLPHLFGIDPSRVHYWICNVFQLGGLVDLDLFITFQGERHHVPLLIFKSKTLVKLRLGRGFKIKLSHQDVYLPMLKTLCLDTVDLEGGHDVLETLLPRCPLLEELVLDDMRWKTKCVSVSSPSLRRLRIRFFNIPIISLDVPNLVYLELSCIFGSKYANLNLDSLIEARLNLWVEEQRLRALRAGYAHLVSADLMDLITAIRNVKVLHLTSDAFELFYYSGQDLPMFDNLVCLSIASDKKQGWQVLPLLIKNSPNLETLIFKGLEHYGTSKCGDACVCSATWEGRPSCLSSSRVKVLEIWGYQGVLRDLLQVKHFLEKLPCLELLKLCAVNNIQVPINVQHLLTLPRASSNCKIEAIP
ncbi:PREDICTED: F-box/LRR-repeat protein At2g42720-like [Camelina sativa]|uniref:F-box/LRR-repeat protein At2g42720-like n=1 Tax=Camelina sativa TaxID=90675 RepID=A0ABM1RNX4_CAMSA|nr:PREDICTED: F-box/LRR-repeat protein At2g42720-like [Camelina sativa]